MTATIHVNTTSPDDEIIRKVHGLYEVRRSGVDRILTEQVEVGDVVVGCKAAAYERWTIWGEHTWVRVQRVSDGKLWGSAATDPIGKIIVEGWPWSSASAGGSRISELLVKERTGKYANQESAGRLREYLEKLLP